MPCPGHPSPIRPSAPHGYCRECALYERDAEGLAPEWVGGVCPQRVLHEAGRPVPGRSVMAGGGIRLCCVPRTVAHTVEAA